jgi:predicted RNA-binding Zn ribbon-like protein
VNVDLMVEQAEGKPAPLPLLALQAFANTLDVEESIDQLDSPESFTAWLKQVGLARRSLTANAADLESARRLRTAVRGLLVANTRHTGDRDATRALGRLTSRYRVPLSAGADGRLEPDLSPAHTAEDLVPRLLAVIFQAQATGTFERLKICENDECQWAFYDSSRNQMGTWCRMGLCGNRLKNRAYRERQRSA